MSGDGQSHEEIWERARAHVGDDRHVLVRSPWRSPVDIVGSPLAYISVKGDTYDQVFHADPDCPRFPEGTVKVYALGRARRLHSSRPCGHCTTEGDGR